MLPSKVGLSQRRNAATPEDGFRGILERESRAATQPAASQRAQPCSRTPAAADRREDRLEPPRISSKGHTADSQALHPPLPLRAIQVSIFLAVVIIRNYILDWSSRTTLGKQSVLLRRGSTERGQGAKSLPANGTRPQAPCLCPLRHSLIAPEGSHPKPIDKLFLMRNYFIDWTEFMSVNC